MTWKAGGVRSEAASNPTNNLAEDAPALAG